MGPLSIYSTLTAMVFFTPHANTREFANAFGLSYRDVNYGVFYAAFGFLMLLSWTFIVILNYKVRMVFLSLTYITGAILYCISYWIWGRVKVFIAGQVLIGCNFSLLFLICAKRGFTLCLDRQN